MQNWLTNAVEKLLETSWYTWCIVAALIAGAVFLLLAGRKTKWNSQKVACAAMCIAISFVFSCIRLISLPQGGSVTVCSMLPIVAFAVAFGPAQGAVVGIGYGLLQLIQHIYAMHPLQILLDYPVAFGLLALGGLVNCLPVSQTFRLPLAILLGAAGRFAAAVISGAVFFGSYAPVGQSALAYSLIYNLGYLGPDALFCILIALIPGARRIINMLPGMHGKT